MDKRKEELITHGNEADNTTDVTDDEITKLDPTEASENKLFEYVVHKIIDHDVING